METVAAIVFLWHLFLKLVLFISISLLLFGILYFVSVFFCTSLMVLQIFPWYYRVGRTISDGVSRQRGRDELSRIFPQRRDYSPNSSACRECVKTTMAKKRLMSDAPCKGSGDGFQCSVYSAFDRANWHLIDLDAIPPVLSNTMITRIWLAAYVAMGVYVSYRLVLAATFEVFFVLSAVVICAAWIGAGLAVWRFLTEPVERDGAA